MKAEKVVFEVTASTKELTGPAQKKAVSAALRGVVVAGVKLSIKKQKAAA